MKLEAACCSLRWFQYAWVSQGLVTSEQGSVSKGNASRVKKWGDSFEYLWAENFKFWKGLCALSSCRAEYIFSSSAKTASAMDEVDTNKLSSSLTPSGRTNRLLSQRIWGYWQLCKCFPLAGNELVLEGTFHGLKSQKALLRLMLVSN